jgi:hypothetical protein
MQSSQGDAAGWRPVFFEQARLSGSIWRPGKGVNALAAVERFAIVLARVMAETQIMTRAYLWMKIGFACLTVLIAELAYLGSGSGAVDWRSLAISISLAWGVLQIVEFFLLREAIENLIAKGVVEWVKTNIQVTGTAEEAALAQPAAPAAAPDMRKAS